MFSLTHDISRCFKYKVLQVPWFRLSDRDLQKASPIATVQRS